jgi:hypothetical protein
MAIPTLKYMVAGQGWPVRGGAWLIPSSTIIDTSQTQWSFLASASPPPDAIPLDQTTYNYMTSGICSYPYWRVIPGPGVIPITPSP